MRHENEEPKEDEAQDDLLPEERQQSFSNPLPSSHFSSPAGIPEVPEGHVEWDAPVNDEEVDDEEDDDSDDEAPMKPKRSRAKKSAPREGLETREGFEGRRDEDG